MLPHLRKVSFPEVLTKGFPKTLDSLNPYCFGQREIHCRGVCLDTEDSHCLLEKLLIQHKICTFHVYAVALLLLRKCVAPASSLWPSALSSFVAATKGSRGYSYRSASTGAMRVALLAGYNVATKLTKIAINAIQMPSCQCGLKGT
jgi:hypothetical protein